MSNRTQERGTILWRVCSKFQLAADRYIPSPFVFCMILTAIAVIAAIALTDTSPLACLQYWYGGFWDQCTFAFQISLYVVTCAVTANAPAVKRLMGRICDIPKTANAAILMLLLIGYALSMVSWVICMICTAVLAREFCKRFKTLHYPLMLAASYVSYACFQGLSPTSSVFSVLVQPGHFLEDMIGVMSHSELTFSPINITITLILGVITILIVRFTIPGEQDLIPYQESSPEEYKATQNEGECYEDSFAEKMNNSRLIIYLLGACGIIVIVKTIVDKGFLTALSLNLAIFIFLIINCFLYPSATKLMKAYTDNISMAAEVMIQFPFYGAIGGILQGSGLAAIIIEAVVGIANSHTVPLVSYICAALVNLFIPSQGGQFIVQGPIITQVALDLDANLGLVYNAFVYGDIVTNLITPLYMLIPLSVVHCKVKVIWGFLAFICVIWMIVTSICLYFLPFLF